MSKEQEIPKQLQLESNVETPLTESPIPQSETQPKNMEVHHHPHVEKKIFKEYFLEFLMIFLAVTMGFFAENIRERFKEKEQGEQYIRSLVEDLESDSMRMG